MNKQEMRRSVLRPLFSVLLLALLLPACNMAPYQVYKFQIEGMYTVWNFSLVGNDEEHARHAVDLAKTGIDRLDNKLAMWKKDSLVHRINELGGATDKEQASHKDVDFWIAFSLALNVCANTEGAFDPTIGPLVRLWWNALQKHTLPLESEILLAKKFVDGKGVGLRVQALKESDTAVPITPGQAIDLGAVAKGYAQDRIAIMFQEAGYSNFLINAGGQVYASGRKPDSSKWTVGILNPRKKSQVFAVIPLENACMATSGDYEQVEIIDGKRYHHILDPRTGWPADSGIISSTVIVPVDHAKNSGALADALATASFVLGAGKALPFLEKQAISGLFVTQNQKGTLSVKKTSDLNTLETAL